MATPLTAERFEQLARGAKIPLVEHDGWRTRNRGQRGSGWGQPGKGVHGVMLHHTVTGDLDGTLRLCRDGGVPGVPAPLYAGLVDKLGRLHMIGWGRCNHAGLGDDDVLAAVIREAPRPPAPNEANTDGNARFYGFAGINWGDGRDPWTAEQLATLAQVSAVVCRHHGWNQYSVIGHKQWQPGKIDPHGPQGFLIPSIQRRVGTILRPPAPKKKPAPKPAPRCD